MSNNIQPYPSYSDHGLSWFGAFPSHWKAKRLGAVIKERGENNKDGRIHEVLSVMKDVGVIPYSEKGNVGNKASEDLTRYKVVRPNDIVVNCMNVIIGSVGISKYTGCLSQVYYVLSLRNTDNDPRYIDLLFRHKPFQKSLVRIGNGILAHRMRIPMELLKAELIPIPPHEEQQKIVNFIQQQERRIRRLISNKKRLIELLKEQRGQIVEQALSSGTSELPTMRDSGIHYLGKVPNHWKLKRFKFVVHINGGQVDPRLPQYKHMILIAPNHIEKETAVLFEQVTAEEQGADSGKYLVREGQIIYSKIRPNLRKATVAPCDCLCSADMYALSINERELDKRYFLKLLLSKKVTHYFQDCSLRVAMPKVNRDSLGDCWLAYPSLDEQRDILLAIEQKTSTFTAAITRAIREVELLQEYRSRLIADAVTGKIDLRSFKIEDVDSKPEDDLIDIVEEDLNETLGDESEELITEATNAN